MASQVTQCPKCSTSFRVTDAQLTIANGAVRCGSCLHIFNAPDHWLKNVTSLSASNTAKPSIAPEETEPDSFIDATPEAQSENQQDALETIFDDTLFEDDFFNESIDEIPDIANLDSDELGDLDESPSGETSTNDSTRDLTADSAIKDEPELDGDTKLFSDDMDTEQSQFDEEEDGTLLIDDDDLLIDDDEPSNMFEQGMTNDEDFQLKEGGDNKFSSSFLDLNTRGDDDSIFKELDDFEEGNDEDDWAKKLLEEEESDTETAQAKGLIGSDDEQAPINDEPDPFATIPGIFDDEEDEEENENENYELIFDTEPAHQYDEIQDENNTADDSTAYDNELDRILGGPTEETSNSETEQLGDIDEESFELNEPLLTGDRIGHNSAFINTFEQEPVVIATKIDRNKWIQRGWMAAIVLAVLALVGQYIGFNFDNLSRDPNYRPTISSICNVIGCSTPDLNDISKIRSTNLVVRSHPSNQQALVVDAIITNRADFQQQFPVMELEFTDLNGEIVAGRHFTPSEYLQGELIGSTTMPAMQPVYISLEIVDPGAQAVNYQLKFHANQGG